MPPAATVPEGGWVLIAPLRGTGRALASGARLVLQALASHDAALIRAGHSLPPLYDSGVRYEAEDSEGTGWEEIADPWLTLARMAGDCDDLLRWRLAELLAAGEPATPAILWTDTFHTAVRRADGQLEDPTRYIIERDPRWLRLSYP